ncbi:MAG: hypothetical protein GW817_12690 [Flavobacteriales bacterium]|nr:hypothetical protein [Flavobacteriales bacterium]NCT14421.1 hypothetical protein [Flavobacteriales bacterium]
MRLYFAELLLLIGLFQTSSAQTVSKPAISVGHIDAIKDLELIFDKNYLVSSGFDKTVKFWHTESGTLIRTIAFEKEINELSFSRNHELLLVSSDSLYLFHTRSAKKIKSFSVSDEKFTSSLFSNDSTKIFSSHLDGIIRVWNVESGEIETTFPIGIPLKKLALSPNDSLLICLGYNETELFGLNSSSGKPAWEKEIVASTFNDVRFSENGDFFLTGGNDRTVKLWDSKTGKISVVYRGLLDEVQTVLFSEHEDMIAACGAFADNRAFMWNRKTRQIISKIEGDKRSIEGAKPVMDVIRFSGNGNFMVSGNRFGELDVWDIWKGDKKRSFTTFGSAILTLSWNQAGNSIAIGTREGKVYVVPFGRDSAMTSLNLHQGMVTDLEFAENGKRLISSGLDKTVKITSWQLARPSFRVLQHDDYVFRTSISANGKYILSASRDGFLRIWDYETGELLSKPGQEGNAILTAGFMQNDKTIFSYELGKLVIRDMWTGITQQTMTERTTVWASSPDRTFLFSAPIISHRKSDQTALISVYSGKNMKFVKRIKTGLEKRIIDLEVSGNSKKIVAAFEDYSLGIFDIDGKNQYPLILKGHKGLLKDLAFSPNSKWIASASNDGTLRVWNSDNGEEVLRFYVFKDGKNWFAWGNNGFFDGTEDAMRQLFTTSDDLEFKRMQDFKYTFQKSGIFVNIEY